MAIIDRRSYAMGGHDKRNVNNITQIGIHYSATRNGNTASFERHWKQVRKWKTGGYHEVVLLDGSVELNYNANVISNGIKWHNSITYNICYVGDGEPNALQRVTLINRIAYNKKRFNVADRNIRGHRQFSRQSTQCPATNVAALVAETNQQTSKPNKPIKQPTKQPAPSKQPVKVKAWKGQLLVKGSKGKHVRQLQTMLVARKFYPNRNAKNNGIDGDFQKDTANAVTRFQMVYLPHEIDGKAGINVYNKLNNTPTPNNTPAPPVKRKWTGQLLVIGMRGDRVEQLQTMLSKLHFYPDKYAKNNGIDKIFGDDTENAVSRFQMVHLPHEVDGKAGRNVYNKLKGLL